MSRIICTANVKSPRHGFEYREIPSDRLTRELGFENAKQVTDYGLILDSVYEMACDIADANGIWAGLAIDLVLKDESWRILPTHRAMIIQRIESRS